MAIVKGSSKFSCVPNIHKLEFLGTTCLSIWRKIIWSQKLVWCPLLSNRVSGCGNGINMAPGDSGTGLTFKWCVCLCVCVFRGWRRTNRKGTWAQHSLKGYSKCRAQVIRWWRKWQRWLSTLKSLGGQLKMQMLWYMHSTGTTWFFWYPLTSLSLLLILHVTWDPVDFEHLKQVPYSGPLSWLFTAAHFCRYFLAPSFSAWASLGKCHLSACLSQARKTK